MKAYALSFLIFTSCGVAQRDNENNSDAAALKLSPDDAAEFRTKIQGVWKSNSNDTHYRFTPIGTGVSYGGKQDTWCSDCRGESMYLIKSKQEVQKQNETWTMWTLHSPASADVTNHASVICHLKSDQPTIIRYNSFRLPLAKIDDCFGKASYELSKETEASLR